MLIMKVSMKHDKDMMHHEMRNMPGDMEWVKHDFDHFIKFCFVERLFLKDFRFV